MQKITLPLITSPTGICPSSKFQPYGHHNFLHFHNKLNEHCHNTNSLSSFPNSLALNLYDYLRLRLSPIIQILLLVFFRSNIRVYYICMSEQCSLKLDLRFDKHDDGVRVIGTCFMLIHVYVICICLIRQIRPSVTMATGQATAPQTYTYT